MCRRVHERGCEIAGMCSAQGLARTADHYGRRLAQIDLTNLAARVKHPTSTIRPWETRPLFSVVLGRALCKARAAVDSASRRKEYLAALKSNDYRRVFLTPVPVALPFARCGVVLPAHSWFAYRGPPLRERIRTMRPGWNITAVYTRRNGWSIIIHSGGYC